MTEVSVVVCTYRRFDHLRLALDALASQTDAPDFEILVVDNSEDPSGLAAFRSSYALPANARVLTSPPLVSLARGTSASRRHAGK